MVVECLNITPSRQKQHRVSLPFPEGGQAVLIRAKPSSSSQGFRRATASPSLFRLLGVQFLQALSVLGRAFEDHGGQARRSGVPHLHRS